MRILYGVGATPASGFKVPAPPSAFQDWVEPPRLRKPGRLEPALPAYSLAGFLQGSFTLHPLPHTGGVGGGL